MILLARCNDSLILSIHFLYSLCVFKARDFARSSFNEANRVLTVQFIFDEQLHKIEPSCRSTPVPVVSFSGTMIHCAACSFSSANPFGYIYSYTRKSLAKKFPLEKIKHIHQGPSLKGSSCTRCINQSVNLVFFHGNRDLITRRSFETCLWWSLMCRTFFHHVYEQDYEAVFWDSVNQCAKV